MSAVVGQHVAHTLIEHGEERVECTETSKVHDVLQRLAKLQALDDDAIQWEERDQNTGCITLNLHTYTQATGDDKGDDKGEKKHISYTTTDHICMYTHGDDTSETDWRTSVRTLVTPLMKPSHILDNVTCKMYTPPPPPPPQNALLCLQ